MAPPNTLFIREVAQAHAMANFLEIMEFLDEGLGLIDFMPDAALGGDFVELPRVGQVNLGFDRADIDGTLSASVTAATTLATNERMVVLHRTLLTEFFQATVRRGSIGVEAYSAEMGRQMAIKAAIKLLSDLYVVGLASTEAVALDHENDVYVDTTVAGSQVDLTPTVVQSSRFKMTDHMETLDIGVCNSKQWNDMVVDLISNSQFIVPNIVGDVIKTGLFRTVLGVTFIVDDQIPTLAGPTTSSPAKQRALFARSRMRNPNGEAPFTMSFQRPLIIHEQHVLAQQSRKDQMQGEIAYAIGVRGSQYDSVNGTVNPDDANLALTTNWDPSNDDDEQHGLVSAITN